MQFFKEVCSNIKNTLIEQLCNNCTTSIVTRFEKTWLPHTHNIKLTIPEMELLAQYTIIFHCVLCFKVTSLVSVAAFLRPCVSLEWHFGTMGWSWLSCIVLGWLDKP